jgi:serine/threonine protein kinase
MNEILAHLQRGERDAAIEALRRLANGAEASAAETSNDVRAMSGPPSREIWAEVLRRIEQRGVLAQGLSTERMSEIVREVVAECVRDAIREEASGVRRTSALSANSLSGERAADGEGAPAISPLVPDRVGNYVVVRELGAGGFGRVYLAYSDDDLKLGVAIKILHDPSPEQQQRFAAERSILANLRHPNIARFESSGVLSDGRPWIAMEYIEGLPLLGYCERERLGTQQRLQLFQKICDAVHEAHKWGVIHLDIKPANIMVTLDGEPKLLDFGIAKIARSFDPTTRATASRGSLTYLYSSPEQLRHEPVSTASDVYNLGLVLYELLTGSRARQSAARQIDAFVREALSREPELPSKRVERLADAHLVDSMADARSATATATTSQGGPSKLARKLRGDLDTIVMMAIRIEPLKRYGSAKDLAEDIGRHLERLPIVARKHSFGYRLGIQLQRHRVLVAAALLVMTTSIAVGFAAFADRERRAQGEILAREREISEQRAKIVSMEAEARKARRELERGPDRQLGWVRLALERSAEVRQLLESRVADERLAFELVLDSAKPGAGQVLTADQVRWLLEAELKLIGLLRRSKVANDLAEAHKSLDALASRVARVPDGVLPEAEKVGIDARIIETRGELFEPRSPERKRCNVEALALRRKLIELRDSDAQSRYDLGKLLARFVEAALDEGDPRAALAHALEMRSLRESVLADARIDGASDFADRTERDLALAHRAVFRAALASGDVVAASAAADEALAVMRDRFARPGRDARNPEAEVDFARALDERLTVALEAGDADESSRLSAGAADRALSAAIACISNVPELREMLDIVNRRMSLLLLDEAVDRSPEADEFARTVIGRLEIAHAGNERSVLRSDDGIGVRIERLQLLQAEAQGLSGRASDALVTVANLGLARREPQDLIASAKRRSVWIVGLVMSREAASRGRMEDARRWADFAIRAALERESRLEARLCLRALERLARDAASGVRAQDLPQLAQLRSAAALPGTTQASAPSSAPKGSSAQAGGG